MIHWHAVTESAVFFIMPREIYIFGNKMISTLRGLTHENVEKMAHKIFIAPNHLKFLGLHKKYYVRLLSQKQ